MLIALLIIFFFAFTIYAYVNRRYPVPQSPNHPVQAAIEPESTSDRSSPSSKNPLSASQPLAPAQTKSNNRPEHKQAINRPENAPHQPNSPSSLPAYSVQTKDVILAQQPQLAALRKTHEKEVDEFLLTIYSHPDAQYDYRHAVKIINNRIQARSQLSKWLAALHRDQKTVSGILQLGPIGHVFSYHYDPQKGIQVHNYIQNPSKAAPNQAQPYVVPSQPQAIAFTSNIPAQCYPIIQKLFDASNALKVNADITNQVLPASELLDDIKAANDHNNTSADKWVPTMHQALQSIDPLLQTAYAQGALGSCMYTQACPYMSLFIANLMAAGLAPENYYMPKDLETALMDVLFGYQISMVHVTDENAKDESSRFLYNKMNRDLSLSVFDSFLSNPEQLQHKRPMEMQQELEKFIHPDIHFTLDERRQSNIDKLFACKDFHAVLKTFNCKKAPTVRLSIFEKHSQRSIGSSPQWH